MPWLNFGAQELEEYGVETDKRLSSEKDKHDGTLRTLRERNEEVPVLRPLKRLRYNSLTLTLAPALHCTALHGHITNTATAATASVP